jgi:hypothetical protein
MTSAFATLIIPESLVNVNSIAQLLKDWNPTIYVLSGTNSFHATNASKRPCLPLDPSLIPSIPQSPESFEHVVGKISPWLDLNIIASLGHSDPDTSTLPSTDESPLPVHDKKRKCKVNERKRPRNGNTNSTKRSHKKKAMMPIKKLFGDNESAYLCCLSFARGRLKANGLRSKWPPRPTEKSRLIAEVLSPPTQLTYSYVQHTQSLKPMIKPIPFMRLGFRKTIVERNGEL